MAKRIGVWIGISLSCLLLTGCWDRREIEDIGFVIGVAIDAVADDERVTGPIVKDGAHQHKIYSITLQIVNSSSMLAGSGGGEGEGKTYTNITTQAETMTEAIKYLGARMLRTPFLEQLQVVLVAEEVARTPEFSEIFDFFVRYPEIRRGTSLYVVKGEAKKALNAAPESIRLPAFYINKISENTKHSSRLIPTSEVGNISESMLSQRSFTILYIVPGKTDVSIVGSAVFGSEDFRMVGTLEGPEAEARNLIVGETAGGAIPFQAGESIGIYHIQNVKTKITLESSNPEKLKFKIKIKTEGLIHEIHEVINLNSPYEVDKINASVAEEIKRLAELTVKKSQEELQVDVLGLAEYLTRRHPRLWKEIKQDWEKGKRLFVNSEITVEAEASLCSTGVTNETRAR